MIENDEDFETTRDALRLLEEAVLFARKEYLPADPINYALFAERPIEMIRELRHKIDQYLGLEPPDSPAPSTAECESNVHLTHDVEK